MAHTLGSISRLGVQKATGFEYAQTAALVLLISDGVSTGNEVMQQGSIPSARCEISGVLFSFADVATIRGYYLSKETVIYTSPVETRSVKVLAFTSTRNNPYIWQYDMTLIEDPEAES